LHLLLRDGRSSQGPIRYTFLYTSSWYRFSKRWRTTSLKVSRWDASTVMGWRVRAPVWVGGSETMAKNTQKRALAVVLPPAMCRDTLWSNYLKAISKKLAHDDRLK
jgi:hypothetical protein